MTRYLCIFSLNLERRLQQEDITQKNKQEEGRRYPKRFAFFLYNLESCHGTYAKLISKEIILDG
jgi:hypothetical protein